MGFTPQAFGKYYLVDKIATGGMAEIFKAKTYSHGGFENLLVIKRILPHIGENEDFIEMFIDEAKVSVALQHANIVRVYDFGKILDNYFIAMECVDGKDSRNLLRKLARKKQYLPAPFAAFIAHEVCKGLQYAHSKTDLQGNPYGIVHRDISPSNVIIAYEGDVKVADFGIAKAESNAYQTQDGVLKGKYEYMSPEQAAGKEIDHRSDLFSVGIILWETLTGRRLFKTDSEIATLTKIREGEIRPPSQLNPEVPQLLEDICLKALARYPADRYQSAQEMADDLRRFLLPAAPDHLRDEMGKFMHDLFREEIAEERARLEESSTVARKLKDAAGPESWDGHDSTMGTRTVPPATGRQMVPVVLALLLGVLGVGGLGVGAAVWYVTSQEPPDTVAEVATTGMIDVLVLPSAELVVDGESMGNTDAMTLRELAPGPHKLRLQTEGYEPLEETVQVVAGETVKFSRTLKAVPVIATPPIAPALVPEPEPDKPKAPAEPVVFFKSSPSGATVRVDGKIVGTTPLAWDDGSTGRSYSVTLELAGFQSVTGRISSLKPGNTTFDRQMPQVAAPGALTVTVVGGGWANVYVNGTKLKKTAPLKDWSLDAGTYEIRVENTALGIDQTEKVKVGAGETVTVRAAPK